VTEIRDPNTGEFMKLAPFVYADGSDVPPELLRDVPEQNYLDSGIRALGLSLMAIALLLVLLGTTWIVIHRNHHVVIAAQPPFLYAVGPLCPVAGAASTKARAGSPLVIFVVTALLGMCYHFIEYILYQCR
jgi:hypothetical protein